MIRTFDPIKNAPVTFEVFNREGESIFKTQSLNDASDKASVMGWKTKIVATDSKGNKKDLSL